MKTKPAYPEHEKLKEVHRESQAQGDFIAWLRDEKDLSLCYHDEHLKQRWPSVTRIEDLLAEYHGIDQKKLDDEKRDMLERMRDANATLR